MATWRVPGLDAVPTVPLAEQGGLLCRGAGSTRLPLSDTACSWGDTARRGRHVLEAWRRSQSEWAGPAVTRPAGDPLSEIIRAACPWVIAALEELIRATFHGGSAECGRRASGAMAAPWPEAGVGERSRLLTSARLVQRLGMDVLADQVKHHVAPEADELGRGIELAFHARGHLPTLNLAAQKMAIGTAAYVQAIARGVIAYAAREGLPRTADHLASSPAGYQLVQRMRASVPLQREIKVDHWLIRLGIPRKPREVRERVATAVEFLERIYPPDALLGYLRGIDFSRPVRVISLVPPVRLPAVGETVDDYAFRRHVLVQYHHPKYGLSNYFTWLRGGAPLTRLGIAQGPRTLRFFVVARPVPALESYASPVNDTWTLPATVEVLVPERDRATGKPTGRVNTRTVEKGQLVGGGGLQLILPVARTAGDALVELAIAD